eukprot:GHUV01040439.1.p1 GENE.GHUV01040439.1~~GHUV01040439.1.p1  ORF type:complete len:104 (-),score=25.15 GHUV01040439.1:210-521(-)
MNGGLSGMGATCLIQPIDMVKVRLQLGATGGPVSATAPLHHVTSAVPFHVSRVFDACEPSLPLPWHLRVRYMQQLVSCGGIAQNDLAVPLLQSLFMPPHCLNA